MIALDGNNPELTSGTYATEPDAWAHFDELVTANKAFRMYREVCGEYLQPRPNTVQQSARVDRLLIPLPAAITAGWRLGAIAVEGKKSGHDIGPMVSQALDYSRCLWRLPEGSAVSGLLVATEWVFVYPVNHPTGAIESVMAQNRVGWCMAERRRVLFASGGTYGLVLYDDGRVTVKPLLMGRKRGSP